MAHCQWVRLWKRGGFCIDGPSHRIEFDCSRRDHHNYHSVAVTEWWCDLFGREDRKGSSDASTMERKPPGAGGAGAEGAEENRAYSTLIRVYAALCGYGINVCLSVWPASAPQMPSMLIKRDPIILAGEVG